MMTPTSTPWLYPDVPAILDGLQEAGVKLAVSAGCCAGRAVMQRCQRSAHVPAHALARQVASRTPTPHVANAFLDRLQLRQRFQSIQLIPASGVPCRV